MPASSKEDIREQFFDAKKDFEEVELPGGQTCYMRGLSVVDVQEIQDAKDEDDNVPMTVLYRKIYRSVYSDRSGGRAFEDREIDDLLEIPHNHRLAECLLDAFNRVNDFNASVDESGEQAEVDTNEQARRRRKKK